MCDNFMFFGKAATKTLGLFIGLGLADGVNFPEEDYTPDDILGKYLYIDTEKDKDSGFLKCPFDVEKYREYKSTKTVSNLQEEPMEKIKFSVTKNGKRLSKKLYIWDEEIRAFSTEEDNLVLDFDGIDNCIFKTGYSCTFDTGSGCTFDTGSGCTFKTGDSCVLIRRDIFEFYDISNKQIQTCPYEIKGYIENGYYYVDGEKQYKAIIIDNILSEVINHRGNVYKVKNYSEDKISYIVQDGDIYSHGATIKEARESLIYKISNRDTSIYNDVKLDDEFDLKDIIKMYRVITGACEAGTRYFVENNKLPDKLTVKQTIDLTQGQYGNEQFKKFFEERK